MSEHHTEPDVEISVEDHDLNYVKNIRQQIIAKTFADNKLPVDKLDATLLMDSLAAMERTAIARKRLSQDKDKDKSISQLAVALAQLTMDHIPSRAPETVSDRAAPVLDDATAAEFEIEDYEMSSNDNSLTYQEFRSEREGK